MSLIAKGCLVSFSPGAEGNNGVDSEDTAGCDLIWMQDAFQWPERECFV